jgi:hypothetical protein
MDSSNDPTSDEAFIATIFSTKVRGPSCLVEVQPLEKETIQSLQVDEGVRQASVGFVCAMQERPAGQQL